jgi:hypothetical protein
MKNNNKEIKDINPTQIHTYWKELFFINHNKIVDYCIELKKEIQQLREYVNFINSQNNQNKNENDYIYKCIIQKSGYRTLLLFDEISNSITINKNCLNAFLNDLNDNVNKKNTENKVNQLISENDNNYNYISQITDTYKDLIFYYNSFLDNK